MNHAPRPNSFRDAWAGDLTGARCGTEVRVAGWVHRRRDHGGLIFIDLRDRSGLVQLVVHPQASGDAFAVAEDLRSEHVVSAAGEIVKRAPENVNPNLATGDIEIHVRSLLRLAASETPPFAVDEDAPVDEMLRLQHRMLDLRRENMREAMELRHDVAATMRRVLNERDFLEIETPILTRSTPEGARDFLVPSRAAAGLLVRAAAVAPAVQAAADDRAATSATTRSPAASATRTCAPTASPSSPSSTSRWPSSTRTTSSRRPRTS